MSNLKIEYVSKDQLKPYAKNAKLHTDDQVEQIKRSIEEFGFNDPIAVWHEDEIIEGHGRLLAVMEMPEIETVPIIRLDDLTDEQRRAYMLVHNKLTMNTDFDFELLDSELGGIIDIDMSEYGFDIEIEEEEPDEIIDDEVPEEVETRCKLGDIWQLGNHRLICGDSTSIEQIDRLMNGEYADMVFTDPPWNVNYGATNHPTWKQRSIKNDSMSTEDFKEFMYNAFKAMNNASKAGCMTYVVMSAQEWGNMMLTLAENDYHWSSTIIWNKDQLVLSRKDYHTKYEPIWYGWKAGESRLCPLEDRKQCDVWDFERPKRSDEHPTMKPVPLVARAITNSSKKGNNVLDLFGGSGTTLIACEQTGRKCFMSELDEHSAVGESYRAEGGKVMRIYISGAMSSCMSTYRQKFARAQKMLEDEGHIVINPAVLPVGLDMDKYMPICLSMVDGADAIFLFNNWQNSKGALLEKAYAEYQGKEILFDV